jgi:hypothetical protein
MILVVGGVAAVGFVWGAGLAFLRVETSDSPPVANVTECIIGMVDVEDDLFLEMFVADVSAVKHTVWDPSRMTNTDQRRVAHAVTVANRLFERGCRVEIGGVFALGLAASDAHVCFKFVALAIECSERSSDVTQDARRWLEISLAVYEHESFAMVGLDGLLASMKPTLQRLCSGEVFVDELD